VKRELNKMIGNWHELTCLLREYVKIAFFVNKTIHVRSKY